MSQLTIDSFMTANPTTTTPEEMLAGAKMLMREQGVRHLPVMEDGKVVGILSEREVDLIAAIAEVPSDQISVRRAMITNVLEVPAGDALAKVAQEMAAAKCGSAVVMADEKVVGIFTTVDALAALAQLATTQS
jgi:acetoin utilization protein AcuB